MINQIHQQQGIGQIFYRLIQFGRRLQMDKTEFPAEIWSSHPVLEAILQVTGGVNVVPARLVARAPQA